MTVTYEQVAAILDEHGVPKYATWANDGTMIAPVPESLMKEEELVLLESQLIAAEFIGDCDYPEIQLVNPDFGKTLGQACADRAAAMPDAQIYSESVADWPKTMQRAVAAERKVREEKANKG